MHIAFRERERERERERRTTDREVGRGKVHEVHISSLRNPVAANVLVSPEVYYDCEMYPAGTTYQKID